MRIALCLEYPINQQGGTEVLVSELIKGLAKHHQIILVSPDNETTLAQSEISSLITEHISFTPVWKSIKPARELAKKIALTKPDLAHFHFGGNYGWGNRFPFRCPIYFLHRLNVPCFSTVHLVVNLFSGYCGPQKPAWFKLLMLPVAWYGKLHQLSHTRREVAVSKHDFQKLCRWYWPFRRRFRQIYHSRLPENPPPMAENLPPVILNVGHIAWRKGQTILAKAFAQIAPRYPEWHLQLAGPYTEEEAAPIRAVIGQFGLHQRISLLGARADAFELMRNASIYVQPSFWEALGLALQEAMFAGCACIGSRAGGIPELIQAEQNGLLFEPGNVDELARSLERLICDRQLREQLSRAAAASIVERKMTSPQMIKHYLELYESRRESSEY